MNGSFFSPVKRTVLLPPGVVIYKGDICELKVDAIVTAGNTRLAGCGLKDHCIDAAVFSAAGPKLFDDCARLGGCAVGQAKITPGHLLPAKYVIHVVGPELKRGQSPSAEHRRQLEEAYRNTLDLARRNGVKSIALCCVSTGLFGFPKAEACSIAVSTVKEQWDAFDQIVFCVFTDVDLELYRSLLCTPSS